MIRVTTDTETHTDIAADKIDVRLNGILLCRMKEDNTIIAAYADGAWQSAEFVTTE